MQLGGAGRNHFTGWLKDDDRADRSRHRNRKTTVAMMLDDDALIRLPRLSLHEGNNHLTRWIGYVDIIYAMQHPAHDVRDQDKRGHNTA